MKAGWPQQIWAAGTVTVTPAFSRSVTTESPVPGKKRSTRHVTSSCTRASRIGDSIRWAAMRWLRFETGGRARLGYSKGADVQPVVAETLQDVIAGRGTADAGAPIRRADVTLLAPLRPGKIICVGLNYMDHCREQKIEP